MKFSDLAVSGCLLIEYDVANDHRGHFVKTFNRDLFKGTVIETFALEEEFFTTSHKDVVRGMHFQTPPYAHNKIVSCVLGSVTDVLLDLRKNSNTYGHWCSVELNSSEFQAIYVPEGVAHGFVARSDNSVLTYKVDSKYAPNHDFGVAWDSFAFNWHVEKPIISIRDSNFPSLTNFKSPF